MYGSVRGVIASLRFDLKAARDNVERRFDSVIAKRRKIDLSVCMCCTFSSVPKPPL